MFLKSGRTVFLSDVGSRFQACGPATESALEPTDDDTRAMLYCTLSAECSTWKCREWYDCVLKVSWRVSECDTVHQDTQLVRNTLTDRQPVEHLPCSCDVIPCQVYMANQGG